MTQTKTKKALLMSVLSMVLCVAMLVGMTFAWFTDTASTGVNKIQAGNLKMEVSYKNTADGEFAVVSKDTPVLNENALWEPGHVEYVVLKVKNVGSLALKYKLGINIASETGSKNVLGNAFKLSDYIKFAVVDGDQSRLGRAALVTAAEEADSKLIKEGYASAEQELRPESAPASEGHETLDVEKTVTLVVWMAESVGNEANHATDATTPEINLGINVSATQYTYESDSFGNDYDASADYPEIQPVSSSQDLEEALESEDINGKTIKLYDDIDIATDDLTVDNKEVAIDLNGNEMTIGKGLKVKGSTVVFKDTSENGDGQITVDNSGLYGVLRAENSDVTIEGGKFVSEYANGTSGYARVISVNDSNLTINGGYFENSDAVGSYNYMIDVNEYSRTDETTITINGGEFVSHRSYGYFVTGGNDRWNTKVIINGGTFKAEGSYSNLTNVKGEVEVNDCTYIADNNSTVFGLPTDYSGSNSPKVTVRGGSYTVKDTAHTGGFVYCNKNLANAYGYIPGTIILDPVNTLKINTKTHTTILNDCGVTQSAVDADGFYTISK